MGSAPARTGCTLCDSDGGLLIWRGPHLRLIRAQEEGFAAWYRVVWNDHVAEFSDLSPSQRQHCMQVVARFDWDSHFPAPVWAQAQRPRAWAQEHAITQQLPALDAALRQCLEQGNGI